MKCLIALLLLASVFPHSAHAQTAAQAESFLRSLYGEYKTKPNGPDFTGREASSAFTASLVELIRRDRREAHGEVGKLDGDPICDCQDFDGLQVQAVRVDLNSVHLATAQVALRFASDSSVQKLKVDLVWTSSGWRIDDIHTSDMPSLRKLLE